MYVVCVFISVLGEAMIHALDGRGNALGSRSGVCFRSTGSAGNKEGATWVMTKPALFKEAPACNKGLSLLALEEEGVRSEALSLASSWILRGLFGLY